MDITVYLPDDIAQRAKDRKDINLSRMLRDALTAQFEQEDTMAKALEGAQEIKLKLQNENGNVYTGLITGKKIAGNDRIDVYVTNEENVVLYDGEELKYYVEDSQTSIEDLFGPRDQDAYLAAMDALGREAIVDLGI